MSQGFISTDREGFGYVLVLLERSFLQDIKKDELGNITKCKLQNSMHDLAKAVVANAYATLNLKESEFNGSVLCHVSFNFHLDSSWQIPISLIDSKKIRSLILLRQFRWPIEGISSQSICDVIMKFKLLRMLDLHNSGIKVLPNSVGELKHLHYLDLSQNVNIKILPNSICKLHNLQTLKLNHCSNLQTLPRDIKRLVNLRELENESCYSLTQMPQGLRQLSKLKTLSEFVMSKSIASVLKQSATLRELGALRGLRGKLKIRNLRFSERDLTRYAGMDDKRLTSLVLIWDINASVHDECERSSLWGLRPHSCLRELSISGYGGNEFPSWLSWIQNLVKLSLSGCHNCHCLPPRDELPNLQVLVVDELMKLEYILDESLTNESTTKTSFSSLKELRLTNLPQLKGWWKHTSQNVEKEEEEDVAFTCLSKLVVEDCPRLTSMPLFPCLEELLLLKNTRWEPFKRTMTTKQVTIIPKMSEYEASSSTYFSIVPLSNLRAMQIIDMSNGDPNMWQSLPSLRSVTLDHVADINDQLEGLRQVTSLQQLHIWRCGNLKEIPSWISHIKSLKTISIKLCPKLKIPRERLSLIASLKKVEIEDCPAVSHIESMLKEPVYYKEAIWLKGLLEELKLLDEEPIIYSDSQSCIHLCKNPVFHDRTKHVEIKYHFIRDKVTQKVVQIEKVPTEENPSDIDTKVLPLTKFKHCLDLLGVGNGG